MVYLTQRQNIINNTRSRRKRNIQGDFTAAKSKTKAEDSKARATRLFCAEFAQQFDNINSLVQDNERLIGSEQS